MGDRPSHSIVSRLGALYDRSTAVLKSVKTAKWWHAGSGSIAAADSVGGVRRGQPARIVWQCHTELRQQGQSRQRRSDALPLERQEPADVSRGVLDDRVWLRRAECQVSCDRWAENVKEML